MKRGWIYFVVSSCERYVKVGFASDVENRFAGLKTAHPEEIFLDAYFIATEATEKLLHKALKPHRVRGEWFHLTPEIEDLIDDIYDYEWAEEARMFPDTWFTGQIVRCVEVSDFVARHLK
jgi:hypothetical protein